MSQRGEEAGIKEFLNRKEESVSEEGTTDKHKQILSRCVLRLEPYEVLKFSSRGANCNWAGSKYLFRVEIGLASSFFFRRFFGMFFF